MTLPEALKLIRDVPNFPKPGIVFKDLTPVLENARAFEALIEEMSSSASEFRPHKIVAIEARGFIFGAAMAQRLKTGLVLVRKKGKLPRECFSASYELEYGTDHMELHKDAISPRERIILVDDVLATGGTLAAASALVSQAKGTICGIQVVMEIAALKGRDRLNGVSVKTIL